jgi:hypothetical protein
VARTVSRRAARIAAIVLLASFFSSWLGLLAGSGDTALAPFQQLGAGGATAILAWLTLVTGVAALFVRRAAPLLILGIGGTALLAVLCGPVLLERPPPVNLQLSWGIVGFQPSSVISAMGMALSAATGAALAAVLAGRARPARIVAALAGAFVVVSLVAPLGLGTPLAAAIALDGFAAHTAEAGYGLLCLAFGAAVIANAAKAVPPRAVIVGLGIFVALAFPWALFGLVRQASAVGLGTPMAILALKLGGAWYGTIALAAVALHGALR